MDRSTLALLALTTAVTAGAALAQAPSPPQPDRQGRYSMSPVEGGGFARLDTATGAMAICQRRDGDWACRDMEDTGAKLRQENQELTAENRLLKDELKRLEDFVVGDNRPRTDGPGAFKLPTEEDIDKAMGYVERMLKKFRDKLKELETDKRSTPL